MNARLKTILTAVWQSVSAVVALVLIIVALGVGWMLRGQIAAPAAKVEDASSIEADAKPIEYTCSMHPTLRFKNPDDKCTICFMDVIAVADSAGNEERDLVMSEAAMKLAEIVTTPVVREIPTMEVRLVGLVDFDETRLSKIAAYFPGRLERLYVDYTGVPVAVGDHLAEIYSPQLYASQAELIEAVRAVKRAENVESMLRAAQTRLDSSREKLRLWGLTDEQIAGIEQSGEPSDRMTIYAPMGGIVVHKNAVEGAYVKEGEPIYTLADLTKLWVKLDAYESDMPWIRYGQEVEFTSQSLPGEKFSGRISFVDPVLTAKTRTVRVRVNVDNSDGRLKPGMFVRGIVRPKIAGQGAVIEPSLEGKWISPMHPEIVKDEPGDCDVCGMPLVRAEELGFVTEDTGEAPLIIPATAPLITGKRAVVYVREPDTEQPTFSLREIVLGPRAGDVYLVREGLEEGEEIVLHGAFKIDSALQLEAKPSMMYPEGGGGAAHDHEQMQADETAQMDEAQRRTAAPAKFIASLEPVYESYFTLQAALAGDDFEIFKQAAAEMHTGLGRVDAESLPLASQIIWKRLVAALTKDAEHIGHLADIDAARTLFEGYAKAIIELDERFGHPQAREHIVAHCPMAFDFKGASWLQLGDEINNPYFGSEMLRCGDVTGRIGAAADEHKGHDDE